MAPSRRPGEGQEGLFVTADPNDIAVATQALPEVPADASVNRVEQARYLSDVLVKFDQLPDKDAWIRKARNPSTRLHADIYSGGPQKGYQIIHDRETARGKVHDAAKESFKRAYGMYAAIDAKVIEPETAERGTAKAFAEFEGKYMGATPVRFEKRESYRKYLKSIIDGSWVEAAGFIGPLDLGPRINFKAAVSLARMLRPEFFGLNPKDYEKITDEDMERFSLDNVRKQLFNVPYHSPNCVEYYRDVPGRREGEKVSVVADPDDWKLLRSVPKLAEAGINLSESKQRKIALGTYKDAEAVGDPDAPRRGGINAVSKRKEDLQKYLDNALQPSLDLIAVFEEALQYGAGLSRFGLEAGARMKFAELQHGTIQPMLLAASINSRLPKAGRTKLLAAVEKRVHFAGDTRSRRQNFTELLALAREWREAEVEAYRFTIRACEQYEAEHQVDGQRVS